MQIYRSYVVRDESGKLGYSDIETVEVGENDLTPQVILSLAKNKICSVGVEGDKTALYTFATDRDILYAFMAGMNHEWNVRNQWDSFWK